MKLVGLGFAKAREAKGVGLRGVGRLGGSDDRLGIAMGESLGKGGTGEVEGLVQDHLVDGRVLQT